MAVPPPNANATPSTFLLHNHNAPPTTPDHASFHPSPSYTSFLGSRSMVSFSDGLFFCPSVHGGGIGEDDVEDYVHQPEKKRRLTADQVHYLERSFEIENKLEPERKIQLAKDLGLQPRQVAIWFQNRRARWKNKQLEKEYESLENSYTNLKASYENLLKEKDRLTAEVASLSEEVLQKEENKARETKKSQKFLFDSAAAGASEQEGMVSSIRSDIMDSESPNCTDGVHSSFLKHCDSCYTFEADQSDVSQDEEYNLGKSLFSPYMFPKLETVDNDYSEPPESSCHFAYAEEDHTFWSWSY